MKCDNVNLIVENENLQGKIDDMKEDVSKKKILEFEMEKLKIKEKKFSESSSNFFHNTFKEKFRDENNNNLYQTMEKESLSSLIMKTNLENAKQQLEETKKIFGKQKIVGENTSFAEIIRRINKKKRRIK